MTETDRLSSAATQSDPANNSGETMPPVTSIAKAKDSPSSQVAGDSGLGSCASQMSAQHSELERSQQGGDHPDAQPQTALTSCYSSSAVTAEELTSGLESFGLGSTKLAVSDRALSVHASNEGPGSGPIENSGENLSSEEFATRFHQQLKSNKKDRDARLRGIEKLIAVRRKAFWSNSDGIRRVADSKALLDWRDGDGFSMLHWSAMAGSAEAVLLLLELGYEVDIQGPNKQTPLMWAAMEEELFIMGLLVKKGANVEAHDDLNDNVITLAAQHEKLLSCLWGIAKGADINCCNVMGSSAAHWAAFSGAYVLLAALDAFEADLDNAYDSYGLLPLHRALQLEFFASARMLVDLKRSRVEAKTKAGLDLITFAEENDISKTWFEQWLKVCKNPKHKVEIGDKKKLLGTGDDLNGSRDLKWWKFWHLRAELWDKFADILAKMEENELGRISVPAIALVFAATFVAAWKMELWRMNQLVFSVLPLGQWLSRVPPYAGLVGIVMFIALLVQDPGMIPKNITPAQRRSVFQNIQARLTDVRFLLDLEGTVVSSTLTPLLQSYLESREPQIDVSMYLKDEETSPETELKREARKLAALARIDASRICPTCWIQKDLRTKHCSVCDSCCQLMDHHCVWLNKCVGKDNHRMFVAFVGTAGVIQLYHMFLILLELCLIGLDKWVGIRLGTRAQFGVATTLVLIAAGFIHFVTYRWSVSLVSSQCTDMVEGITINESFSMTRYDHFLCDVEYTYSPEKMEAMRNALIAAGIDTASSKIDAQRGSKATGPSPVGTEQGLRSRSAKFAAVKLEGIGNEVVPKTKEEPKLIQETITRRFLRNPFTINKNKFEIIKDFWLGRRATQIEDFESLLKFDAEFRRTTTQLLRERELHSLGNATGERTGSWWSRKGTVKEA